MSRLLQHEEQRPPGEQHSSGSLTTGTPPVRARIMSHAFRFLKRCTSALCYTIAIVAIVAAFLELIARAAWSIHPITRQAELENQGASPVYAGAAWSREFWQEESARRKKTTVYVPFRIWGVTDWHGKYINNDQTARGFRRRTINPNCNPEHELTVWTFGGSTMYGTAVPDWATIPSYLSRDLNSGARDCIMVTNFGVEGYVTDQELMLLTEQLKVGGHPDIVIFYDGVNDSSLAWPPSSAPNAHFLFGKIKSRVEGSLSARLDFLQKSYALRLAGEGMARLHSGRSFASAVSQAQPNVIAAFNNYEANMRVARVLGDAYNFRVYCFWQPMLTYGHKPLVPFEQQMATRDASGTSAESAWFLTMAAVFREAERQAANGADFVFLGDLFDSTQEPIYVDEAHLGPRGNEIVAQAIASYLRDHPVSGQTARTATAN